MLLMVSGSPDKFTTHSSESFRRQEGELLSVCTGDKPSEGKPRSSNMKTDAFIPWSFNGRTGDC